MEEKINNKMSEVLKKSSYKKAKSEKISKVLYMIKDGEVTINDLTIKLEIPRPTMYKYIKELKDQKKIYEKDKHLYIMKEKKKNFNGNRFLEFILPNILYTVNIRRIMTFSRKDTNEDILQNPKRRHLKIIMIEFTQRGYEKDVAEILYDKFIDEIQVITVGIGGVIIYLSENNIKTKVFDYLRGFINNDDE